MYRTFWRPGSETKNSAPKSYSITILNKFIKSGLSKSYFNKVNKILSICILLYLFFCKGYYFGSEIVNYILTYQAYRIFGLV